MLYLKNLCSSETFDGIVPWEVCDLSQIPFTCFKDKKARDNWINNPELQYHVYTMFEGVQKNVRLRGAREGVEGNSVAVMHGVAVDYDTSISVEEIQSISERFGEKLPAWFEQTLSGNGRLIWLFETPVNLPSRRFLKLLIEKLPEFLPVDRIPGLDRSALETPERYFTNGARWTKLSNYVVPTDLLTGWIIKASEKFDWTSKELGKAISLKSVEEECRIQFPKFLEWPGEFVLGAQGPSFWLPESTSPKSAIVRETGMHTFSAHASKAFYSWAEIVGSQFVDKTEHNALGKAVSGIFYDGQKFVWKDTSGKFVFESRQNLELILRVQRGVSDRKPKGGHSDLEQAITHVLDKQRVDGATSCAFYPHGVFTFQGKRILNTHQIEAMKPADTGVWGPEGNFPFVSTFLDTFFDPSHPQLDFFLAWLQLFYRACLRRTPRSGQSVFVCGPVNVGKGFLNHGIVAGVVGGHTPANEYLVGSDNFNSELFDTALWTVDDGSVMSSAAIHRLFSENVKKAVANRHHRANEKYRKAVITPWQGRIFVTCNDDAISIRIIPDLSISVREKLMIFRAGIRKVQFRSQPEMEALLTQELPNFCRWILDWKAPEHCFVGADVRFGVGAYCEESLARSSNRSSNISVFAEMLTQWLREYFQSDANRGIEFWEGSATQLRIAMSGDSVYAEMLRAYKPESIPQMLALLQQQQVFKITIHDGDERIFKVAREERFLRNPSTSISIPQAKNSKFDQQ